jgi:hypothetical protein
MRELLFLAWSIVPAGGISQGGLKTLLLIGRNPGRFAAALSINPVVDFLAFDQATECQTEASVKQVPRASVLLQTQQ